MSSSYQKLSLPLRLEVAFAVTKFTKLPGEEQGRILGMLRSDSKETRTLAAKELGDLLCRADGAELTHFMNDHLGFQFDGYLPYIDAENYSNKCLTVGMYFHEHLPQSGTVIPIPSLSG
jgi:hypothetical protein